MYCIYLKGGEPNYTFNSQEHIFPAGLGGIQKLPEGYVSDQCNNAFSALELNFMRNSLIALPRQFVGPGKRGKLSPKKATKSNVSLMSGREGQTSLSFGYLSLGKPYNIPQIIVNINGKYNFTSDRSFGEPSEQFINFINQLKKFEDKYILHEDESFYNDEFVLGYHEGKWHLGLSNVELAKKLMEFVHKMVDQTPEQKSEPGYGTFQATVHQSLQFDPDSYFRTCSKIIFNYLAYEKGQNFVLDSCFDPIRHWIVNGGENHFATLLEQVNNKGILNAIPFPDEAHKLVIIRSGNQLLGYISFYGSHFETIVRLTTNFNNSLSFNETEGYICDWKNRDEFRLITYLNSLNSD
ncbi:hypothetical protein ACFFHF_09985 [Robertmurraya beringensis]|uniref:HNH endonuclease n=1 Tax=Robertmurraya beringensis TaxID=641660 RepID=A0ABV6KQG4_9BACI